MNKILFKKRDFQIGLKKTQNVSSWHILETLKTARWKAWKYDQQMCIWYSGSKEVRKTVLLPYKI